MDSDKEIKKSFKLYSKKTDSDYFVEHNGRVVPTQSTLLGDDDMSLVNIDTENNITVYKNEFIEKLNPDNIDSVKFWRVATYNFPLFSVAGGVQNYTTKYEVNTNTFSMANQLGVILVVKDLYKNKPDSSLLEIGPGYGGFNNFIKDINGDDNYWAIDVIKLFDHPRLFTSDGKTIPDSIPNPIDIVYSINVFQHLSKKQRTSYYRQTFEVLKKGGVFIFGMFTITEHNKDWPCWGTKGEDGKFYCNFFRQLTEVDKIEVVTNELEGLGFSVDIVESLIDSHYLAFKCTKLID